MRIRSLILAALCMVTVGVYAQSNYPFNGLDMNMGIGTDMIWPMSLIMKALTAQNDEELQQCIRMLQKTHAGTGFMHESFHKDDPKKFTRSWFAWANTLFGELLWKTFNEKPYLLEY